MQSIDPRCQELKNAYDECFNKWFQDKFLKGNTKDYCAPLLKSYRECINVCILDYHDVMSIRNYVNICYFGKKKYGKNYEYIYQCRLTLFEFKLLVM